MDSMPDRVEILTAEGYVEVPGAFDSNVYAADAGHIVVAASEKSEAEVNDPYGGEKYSDLGDALANPVRYTAP